MTEAPVALSDYALTVESAVLAIRTYRRKQSRLRAWVVLFFMASAMASLAAGTVHGFASNQSSRGHRILWPATLVSLGITGLAGAMIGAILAFPQRIVTRIEVAAAAGLGIYSCLVGLGQQRYRLAIVTLLSPTAFLGGVLWLRYRRSRQPSLLAGLGGLGVSLLGSAVQQSKLSIGRRLDHNVIYHILQGASLILLDRCFAGFLNDRCAPRRGLQ